MSESFAEHHEKDLISASESVLMGTQERAQGQPGTEHGFSDGCRSPEVRRARGKSLSQLTWLRLACLFDGDKGLLTFS